MAEWNEEQKRVWSQWLAQLPENVRKVAESFPPNKRYKLKGQEMDIGNYYVPSQYDQHKDGSVTITCSKFNDEMPVLGGYGVFGMKPEDLEVIEK